MHANRQEFAMVSLVNNIVSYKIDSSELLSKLNFYIPARLLRRRQLYARSMIVIDIDDYHIKYTRFKPMNKPCDSTHFKTLNLQLTQKAIRFLPLG